MRSATISFSARIGGGLGLSSLFVVGFAHHHGEYEVINMTRGATVGVGRPDRRRWAALVVTLAVVGVFLTACSSGGSSSTSTGATGGSGPNKTAMATVLLRASDFPTGWVESSKPQSTSSDAATKKVAQSITACREFVAQADIEKRHVKLSSTTFTDSAMPADAANEASNQIVGYSSEAQAKTAYAAFASSQTGTCLQQVFDKMLKEQVASINAKGGPVATVTADVQRVGVPSAGDATTAYEIVVSIDVAGTQQQLGFIVQIVRLNQYVVSYNATAYQPLPDKFGENLVDRSMARFEAALSA
jgi:hypothetical protein